MTPFTDDDFKLTHSPNQCCECVQHLEAMLKAAREVMEYASHETLRTSD